MREMCLGEPATTKPYMRAKEPLRRQSSLPQYMETHSHYALYLL